MSSKTHILSLFFAFAMIACTPETPVPGGGDDPGGGGGGGTVEKPSAAELYARFLIPEDEEDGIARAFPGAEGGGMYTTGGRGGKVIHVTTLHDSGTGSLRAALEETGARTIVFDVAGTIELRSDLKIGRGNVTIAGQTAPGDGICLKNYTTNISAGNVIVRYLRFRLGDQAPWTEADIQAGRADREDCIWGCYQENLILDHCSMSWSVDEAASFYANENFTMQWCLIAESMKNCRLHTKGNHGYGGIWGGKNASFHHNVLAHHDSRNARIDHPHIYENHKAPARRGNVDLRNNLVYDWGSNNCYGGEGGWFNLVNCYYQPGPSSSDRKYFMDLYAIYSSCSNCNETNIDHGYASVYLDGNVHTKYASITGANASGINWHNGAGHDNYKSTLSSPLAIAGKDGRDAYVTTHSAEDARKMLLQYAGASLRQDDADKRILSEVENGTGRIILDINDLEGSAGSPAWPSLSATAEEKAVVLDTDGDGMPDAFEDEFFLDRNNPEDGNAKTLDIHGRYTNLEMYLHYLVRNITALQRENGTYLNLNSI